MKQTYRCMQCCLEGRSCMKPPEDFGIYKESDLMTKLFMDGMWTRCQECIHEISNSPQTTKPFDTAHQHQDRKAAETEASNRDSGKPKLECSVCRENKLFTEFPPSAAKNFTRAHRRCRACHRCPECQTSLKTTDFEPDAAKCKICTQKKATFLKEYTSVCGSKSGNSSWWPQVISVMTF